MLDDEPEWVWFGDRRMLVVGYTQGGVPYGPLEGLDDLADSGEEESALARAFRFVRFSRIVSR